MIIIIIVWTRGNKDNPDLENRYYEGSLRHRADINRKDIDVEIGANTPLLRQSKPPQLPPLDF